MAQNLKHALAAATNSRPRATLAALVRLATGIVFVLFGIGKFTSHASEVASFSTYGLPSPDAFVYVIGALEVVAGALLITGLFVRFAALVMAGNMVGAIVVSGIGQGEAISLTLAPVQLVGMLVLLWAGSGAYSLDQRHLRPESVGGDRRRP